MIYVFLADGFEIIEAMAPVDMLGRAKLNVKTVGVGGKRVKSSGGIELTADFIVGFPGESDAHFEETLCFAEEAEFLNLHVFAYSKRQNTPAAALPNQVDEQVKKERSHRLIALGESLRTKRLAHILENTPTVSVLFEERNDGFFVGHTPAFVPVAVKSDAELHGEIADVRPIHHDGVHLFGEIIKIK